MRPAQAHIEAQARLRALVAQGVKNLWTGLPGYDEVNVDPFVSAVVPLVEGGQRHSVALTNAFIARSLGRQPVGVNVDELIGAGVRNGTTPQEVYRRPFVTLWTGLKNGSQYTDALNAAMARATGSAQMDVQLSMRATLGAVQQADDTIYGYQRTADGDACDFCQGVDGAYIKDGDAMPLHDRCGCGVEVLSGPHRSATHLPDGTQIREHRGGPLISTPPPSTVAIEQHGELGPVLTDPSQHFAHV